MSDFDVAFAILPLMLVFASVALISDEFLFKMNEGNSFCGIMNPASPDANCIQYFQDGSNAMLTYSNFFIFIYLGAILGSIFAAAITPSAQMYWILTIVTCALVFLTAPVISNVYLSIVNSGMVEDVVARHATEIWFFQNLPVLAVASHLLVGIALHGKNQAGMPASFR